MDFIQWCALHSSSICTHCCCDFSFIYVCIEYSTCAYFASLCLMWYDSRKYHGLYSMHENKSVENWRKTRILYSNREKSYQGNSHIACIHVHFIRYFVMYIYFYCRNGCVSVCEPFFYGAKYYAQ